ncbi:MAG: UDP-N-acetylmuramoyl-tripeptide--D-alanyl-D-alanine ligase [Chthoniobacterales bacterium]
MDARTLSQIASDIGTTVQPPEHNELTVTRLSKDTRTIEPGDLYLALRGENHDGNAFVEDAIKRGAAAALVDGDVTAPAGFPILKVADSLEALHALATAARADLNLRTVCITGSSGKTSTKEFTSAVLSARFKTTRTQGNLNNHFGLPLTVLEADSSHQAAVWEIGMNHPGEIAPLAAIAKPDIAIITNIGTAHIEFFSDQGRDGIAAEKAALAAALSPDGAAIVPHEDEYADYLSSRTRGRVIRAGLTGGNVTGNVITASADGTKFTISAYGETATAHVPVPGEHMVRNALLAIAAGIEAGLSLDECVEGLSSARLTGGRLQQKTVRGLRILDDSYNANPDSVEAALKTLATLPTDGRRIAILGKMGELGSYAATGYERVGRSAAAYADILIATGTETAPLAAAARAAGLKNVHEAVDAAATHDVLTDLAEEGDVVLIKGSRAAKMEQIIDRLEA